ncbi:hypothetical protein [Sulfuricella denitrificans]|nr:hypothetical protein [Sulfuricella denitrificans]
MSLNQRNVGPASSMELLLRWLLMCFAAVAMLAAACESRAEEANTNATSSHPLLGNARIVDPKEARRNDPFATLHDKPMSENEALIPQLIASANVLPPQYLYELSRRLWPADKTAAMEWLAVGMARARYDALRCTDKTARQGILYLPMIAEEVVKGTEQDRKAFGEAGKRALARSDLFVDTVSPMWICMHGMSAINSAIQGRKMAESDWLAPAAEWTALRENVRKDLASYFDEQGKPQDDPIPMSKTPYPRVTLPWRITGGYAWLDGEHLVAATTETGPAGKQAARLAVWKLDGSKEEIGAPNGIWCAGNGVIAWQTESEKLVSKAERLTFNVGLPGAWTSQSMELRRPFLNAGMAQGFSQSWNLPANPARQSPFDCHWETNESLSGTKFATQWFPLLSGHGAIQFEPPVNTSLARKAAWVRKDGETVRLPVDERALTLESFRYFAWKKAYFVAPLWSRFRQESGPPACVPAAWIYPAEGRVEEVCVPFDTANQSNAVLFSPSRAGWLRMASARITAHGQKPGGLYLVKPNGQTEKLAETQMDSWNVSPDGCRVAFRHRKSDTGPYELDILDLCRAK